MRMSRTFTAVLLCGSLPIATFAAESQVGYSVTYSGGSLPNVKGGEDLKLYLDGNQIRLRHKSQDVVAIPTKTVTEVSYGQEVHRRIGTAAGLAVVSLGIGALVAFSKSKKHYIGITWADASNKGGVVLQADKNEYRGLLTALEGVTGKTAVDTDSPRQPAPAVAAAPPAPAVPAEAPAQAWAPIPPPAPVAESAPQAQIAPQTQVAQSASITQQAAPQPRQAPMPPHAPASPQTIIIRFISTPANAEVQVDGEYWGSTPTADLTRIQAGAHTILVKKLGFQPWERKITLALGDDRTINAELEPQTQDPNKPRISGQQ